MSLRNIELQIAIPKTYEAGKAVEQHQQNVIQQQINAHEALKKDIEKKQFTVMDTEKTDKVSEDEDNSSNEQNMSKREKQQKKKQQEAQHPFKGNFIDFSG
ncbi:RNA polymerase subunit sigma [Lysinibacillus telephonicus]|uniref:RNA polymerase subunit sigma n=1 Tax=Lysinibacillus telephonicus TaxID=1714840 RepID=A0A431UW28_9BACI|nr:RNA polymerase subunit sigma [Lysinibacillus telephonicus]RTQ95233.1 RNA polymerase subunit sigma [Lysinibacillus telephonicus]